MLPPFSLVIDLASSGLHFPFDPVGHLSRLHKATPVSCRSLESLAAQVRLHYLSAIPDPLVAQIWDGMICRFTGSKALPCLLSPRLVSVLHCSAYYIFQRRCSVQSCFSFSSLPLRSPEIGLRPACRHLLLASNLRSLSSPEQASPCSDIPASPLAVAVRGNIAPMSWPRHVSSHDSSRWRFSADLGEQPDCSCALLEQRIRPIISPRYRPKGRPKRCLCRIIPRLSNKVPTAYRYAQVILKQTGSR